MKRKPVTFRDPRGEIRRGYTDGVVTYVGRIWVTARDDVKGGGWWLSPEQIVKPAAEGDECAEAGK